MNIIFILLNTSSKTSTESIFSQQSTVAVKWMSALYSEARSRLHLLSWTGLLDTMERYLLMEEACIQVVMCQFVPLHLTALDNDRKVVSPGYIESSFHWALFGKSYRDLYPSLRLSISCPRWQFSLSSDKKNAEQKGTAHIHRDRVISTEPSATHREIQKLLAFVKLIRRYDIRISRAIQQSGVLLLAI